jgi:Zn-dependent protease with chaperone function
VSPVAQSAQLFLLAGVAFLAIGAVGSAILVGLVRTRLLRCEPRARHRAIVVLAALPVLTALALLTTASLPSLLALFVPGLDHCTAHDDGHAHLCFTHLPVASVHLGVTLGLGFLVGYALLRASLAAARVARALHIVRALTRVGQEQAELGLTIVETAQPVCLAAGFVRPRVLISRGLLESLGSEERSVVLAHERAHVRRRDALASGVVRALAVVHLPRVGAWLVNELDVAAEQACDDEAATAVADRVAVASAILAVERAVWRSTAPRLELVGIAFGARAVERRVEALLAEPLPPTSLRSLTGPLGVALLAVVLHAGELHHATEFLLSAVAH